MESFWKIGSQKLSLRTNREASESRWSFSLRPGGWVLCERKTKTGNIERKRIALNEFRGKLSASLGGVLYQGEIQAARSGSGAHEADDSVLTSQFPGKVRKILVKHGQKVEINDPLLLVEAMKMEFQVKSPYQGRVVKVRVEEGQQVSPGTKFLDLEPETQKG